MLDTSQVPPERSFILARQLQAQGRLAEARDVYEKLLKKIPNHPQSLTMMASICYQLSEDLQAEAYVDRAIEVYQEALERVPNDVGFRASLMTLLLARGAREKAEQQALGLDLPINAVRASTREFFERSRSGVERGIPLLLINTVPKSASESIWNQLAEGLGIAQGHLSLGLYPDCCLLPHRVMAAVQGGMIAKEHLPATPFNLGLLAHHDIDRIVYHVRDPRQVALSWAHFVKDDISMRLMAPLWRKIVPPAGVLKSDFAVLLDWCIDHFMADLMGFISGWLEVDRDPNQQIKLKFLSFEQFLAEPQAYFNEVLDFVGVERALFAADAEAEVVHLRKGESDEWRAVFTKPQRERAWSLIPREMAEAFGWKR